MKSAIIFLACIAYAVAAPFLDNGLDETWEEYKSIYGKSYEGVNSEVIR